jgi:hypothetical protein
MDLHGLSLSAEQENQISKKMAETPLWPTYVYPWAGLEERLREEGKTSVSIVAYGSLVNASSAARTLRDSAPELRRRVIAFGVRRVFNYLMPSSAGSYGTPRIPQAIGALNVKITADVHDALNGLVIRTGIRDIAALRERELGYDLVPVACLWWEDLMKAPFFAYILRAGNEYTSDKIEPHREYYDLCRTGASQWGDEFLEFWLSTTYLADGMTPVAAWEINAARE